MQQTKKIKVSILVPCCNVEKYLRQCLDSIVGQTLKDMEIIVINDGSTDETLDIINEYAARDKRIRVLDKENEGYGKSMNRGLDMARGEYIGIVESDDWVDADMFESLVKIADDTGVDVVKSNFYQYTTTDGEKNIKQNVLPQCDTGHVINPGRESGIFWTLPSIWAAIYRRDFLVKNDIRFLESPGASYQDTGFNFKVWAMASRAYLTDRAYLHYRCDNANSSVKSNGKIFCICDEWDEIDRYLAQRPEKQRKCAKLIPHIKLGGYLWNLNRLTDDARAQFATRFQADFSKYIRRGDFERIHFDDKSWFRLMRTIYPDSQWMRFKKHFFDVVRPLYKTRVGNGHKTWYVFGIRVRRAKLPRIGVC